MDSHQLRNLVFDKTGIKLDVDDPAFALVAMNEAVLDEAVARHAALLGEANAALRAEVEALQGQRLTARDRRNITLAAGAAVLGALLVLAGQALFLRPPAPVAPALTPAQQAALDRAERLNRALDRLDRKTRSAIDAELQKP